MDTPAILIVEDEHVVAHDLSNTVGKLGYRVVGVADSGHEAIRLAGELKPDLALMDIALPGGLDGIAVAEQLRTRWQIPVVFLSAHSDDETVARATESGAFGQLTKPIRINELKSAISIALNQHRAAHELIEQNTWLATLLASISEGVIASDQQGRVEYLNPQAERITGWTLAEAYGRPVEEIYTLLTPSGGVLDETRVRTVLRTGSGLPQQRLLLRNRKGLELPVENTVVALPKPDNSGGAVTIFRDLTETLRFENAQKFETIGVLAAGVAHDFNNLLAIMIGNASLALELLPDGSRGCEYLEQVLRSGTKAADLTAQLLSYAGKGTLRKVDVNLAILIREVVQLIRTTIPGEVAVVFQVPDRVPWIVADPTQIKQLVMNLVINAVEAIGTRNGVIHISVGFAGENDDLAVLRVRDTGPGIDPEIRPKIFDPFFSTKFTGRGLGLAAAQGIVRSHGGSIEVESRRGQGSTFTVTFPAAHAAGAPRRWRRRLWGTCGGTKRSWLWTIWKACLALPRARWSGSAIRCSWRTADSPLWNV